MVGGKDLRTTGRNGKFAFFARRSKAGREKHGIPDFFAGIICGAISQIRRFLRKFLHHEGYEVLTRQSETPSSRDSLEMGCVRCPNRIDPIHGSPRAGQDVRQIIPGGTGGGGREPMSPDRNQSACGAFAVAKGLLIII